MGISKHTFARYASLSGLQLSVYKAGVILPFWGACCETQGGNTLSARVQGACFKSGVGLAFGILPQSGLEGKDIRAEVVTGRGFHILSSRKVVHVPGGSETATF